MGIGNLYGGNRMSLKDLYTYILTVIGLTALFTLGYLIIFIAGLFIGG